MEPLLLKIGLIYRMNLPRIIMDRGLFNKLKREEFRRRYCGPEDQYNKQISSYICGRDSELVEGWYIQPGTDYQIFLSRLFGVGLSVMNTVVETPQLGVWLGVCNEHVMMLSSYCWGMLVQPILGLLVSALTVLVGYLINVVPFMSMLLLWSGLLS